MSLLTESVTDVLNLQDWQQTISHTLAFTDAISVNLILTPNLSELVIDSISLSDDVGLAIGLGLTSNDSLSLSDLLGSVKANAFLSVHDFLVFTDFVQKFLAQSFTSFSDSLSFSDLVIISIGMIAQEIDVTVIDQYSLTDVITAAVNIALLTFSFNDSITLSDDVIYAKFPTNIYTDDALTFSDKADVNLQESFNTYLRRYLNDFISPPPSQGQGYFFQGQAQPTFQFPNQSNISITEAANLPPIEFSNVDQSLNDSLNLIDGTNVFLVQDGPLVSDSISLTDDISTILNTINLLLDVSDSLSFSDLITSTAIQGFGLGSIGLNPIDNLSLSDSFTILLDGSYEISVNDVIPLLFDSVITDIPTRSVEDSFLLLDNVVLSLVGSNILLSDSLNLLDNVVASVGQEGSVPLNFSVGERPTVNNNVATLAHIPVLGTDAVYVNELRLRKPEDYSILSNVITLVNWQPGDYIVVDYQYTS